MLAIVLSRRDFREFDQIVSVYTYEAGKRELLARGIKKITSKHAAHLEPFSVVDVSVVPGKEIDHLTTVQPVEYFPAIRGDFKKSLLAMAMVRITDRLVETQVPDKGLFRALRTWLEAVCRAPAAAGALADAYVMVILERLGLAPVLEGCVCCGKTFSGIGREALKPGEDTAPGIYFGGGGLACPDCRRLKLAAGEQVMAAGLKEISLLGLLLKGDWRLINNYEFGSGEAERLHDLVYAFALYHSERKLGDWGNLPLEPKF